MPAPLVSASRVIPVETSGVFRMGVVADTHSEPHPRARELLRESGVSCIVHAGDIGALRVLDDLALVAPVHAVRGNIDEHAPDLPDVLKLDLDTGADRPLTVTVLHIGVAGPKLRKDAALLARRHEASLVVCGHSHVPFIGRDKGLAVFNPGSIGPRRFTLPIVFGILEIEGGVCRMYHVSCETGARWTP